jgi:F-type H+-transporting ATPase subunit b
MMDYCNLSILKKASKLAAKARGLGRTAAVAAILAAAAVLLAPHATWAAEDAPGLVEVNYTLLIQIANFLILLVVLNRLLYRPLRRIIKERREKFDAFQNEVEGLTDKVERTKKEIEQQLAEARRSGFSKKDEIKSQGLEEEKAIVEKANEQAEAKIQEIKDRIASEISQARQALKSELDAFSRELAQKVLGRSLS